MRIMRGVEHVRLISLTGHLVSLRLGLRFRFHEVLMCGRLSPRF